MEHAFFIVMGIAIPLYLSAIVIYAIRAIRGPTVPDIILAVDCISFDIAAFMAVLAIYFKSVFLIGAPIILALWAYLLDMYVAKLLVSKEEER
ncbi:MAG: pH regulation protein F [Candidatus Hydrothermota bacterium]|nr:MAG: pH regulation protein F [Candidatus Hydrothermae bacterium]